DWSGSWQSVLPYVEDGSVSEFLASKAQENGETIAEARDRYRKRFGSPYRTIEIGERGVRLWSDGASVEAEYAYIGWRAAESDHETGAWYVFERAAQDGDAPKYIAFSDHGTGDAAHFHLRYGPEGPDALARMADWAPTFFDAAADAATIDRALAGHGHEQDEHVWLSLKAASKITRGLCDALCALRPDRADAYRANADAYIEALLALDARYRETIDSAARKTMLFADRFPFRYLADDYGLAYYAAFSGCSAETEASFETVAFLAGKVDELDLPAVLVIEGAAHKIANTVIANSAGKDAKILVLNSLQSVTARDLAAGVSYLDTMEQNLAVLQEALN
ncbi:MAG: zinc ABC transporter solute-binding protein, partial [Clostridiales bacterium]|nr:zinc ABC transporter solute-binding protein [Clostridiales bacterium]